MTSAGPVPGVAGYLGRVLDDSGSPAGTCFQITPGVLVTACHVLEEIGAGDGDEVLVDPLAGGESFTAVAARSDVVRDLAVLTSAAGLAASAGPLVATGSVARRVPVTVTGHVVAEDPGHSYRFLDAPGQWAGGTMRDDAVPLGRLTADAVLPGMSGAPVVCDGDGAVAGVVSGRYNTADGWLRDTVWVARTEDLLPLLEGITSDVALPGLAVAGPVDVVLTVTEDQVRLAGPGAEVSAGHGGVRPGLAEAVGEVRRARARSGLPARTLAEAGVSPGLVSLARAGELLGQSFLPGPVAGGLGRVLEAAGRAHQPVRLGLEVTAGLAWLPWECLPGPDGRPLALHPLVRLYRKTAAAAPRRAAGPLRIVVAIASPDRGGGALLDYERELRNVLAAVRAARQDAAEVRVVPFATPAAIRAELDRGSAHVLHITGHGAPGMIDLEDDDGGACPVTAEQLVERVVPAGAMPPVITLSACYTDAAPGDGSASFAARLCQHGAAAVIATETSVTDIYATRLMARVYAALAAQHDPDVITALAGARREVQAELDTSPGQRDQQLAALGEWAAVTVLAAAGTVPLLDPAASAPAARRRSRPRIAGLAGREDWYFVGRRTEQRRWPGELTGPGLAGIVICGIGGTGKTTLAAELLTRLRDQDPGLVVVSMAGPLTVEGLLDQVIPALRRALLVRGHHGEPVRALEAAADPRLGGPDRWAVLREHVLDTVPVLAVLDNFEDNLQPADGAGYAVRDDALAGLLAAWAGDPGPARLLITSRHPFALPGGAGQALSFRQLGPLSRAETMKLAWSLPALDRLDEDQLDRVWRLAGGHPRSLEYLDALLSGGTARYPDITARLDTAIRRRLSGTGRDQWLAARTGLDAALAETISLAADDILLDDLLARLAQTPGAPELLAGVSVYREPVDLIAVLFQAGQPDPAAEDLPDHRGASRRISEILAAAGIAADDTFDLAAVPARVRARLAPHLDELTRRPSPPWRAQAGLDGQLAACRVASLLAITGTPGQPQFFVHRWTATELATRTGEHDPQLHQAHEQAAAYWQWRVQVWPQDTAADVHDLLEARHHLLRADQIEDAEQVRSLSACS